MAEGAAAEQPRGRPRSEQRDQDILDAALRALVSGGYDAMTIEGIASSIGASKATVYRRWRNKAELVVEAIERHAGPKIDLVDSGDVRDDLRAYLRTMQKQFQGIDGALLLAFTAERIRHPELAEVFDRRFVADRRAHLRKLIASAVDRGDLPADTDVDLLADVGPALMLHRMSLRRGSVAGDLADRIVSQFFPPASARARRASGPG